MNSYKKKNLAFNLAFNLALTQIIPNNPLGGISCLHDARRLSDFQYIGCNPTTAVFFYRLFGL